MNDLSSPFILISMEDIKILSESNTNLNEESTTNTLEI